MTEVKKIAPSLIEMAKEVVALDGRHYHTASADDIDTCSLCGKNFRDGIHWRTGEKQTVNVSREELAAALLRAEELLESAALNVHTEIPRAENAAKIRAFLASLKEPQQ